MTDQTTISTNDVNAQANVNVGTAGHSQQVDVTSTDNNVTNQAGPNAAFAELRRQNEELQKKAAIVNDPEVVKFLQDREAAKVAAEQARLRQPDAVAQELEQLKAWQAQQQNAEFQRQLQLNETNFKSKYQMNDAAFNTFVDTVGQKFPYVSQMLATNPGLDLTPYLAAIYPDKYAAFMAAQAGTAQAAAPAQPVYVAGHANVNQTPAIDQALSDRIAARIKKY